MNTTPNSGPSGVPSGRSDCRSALRAGRFASYGFDVGFFWLKLLQTRDQIRRPGPRDHHPTQFTQPAAQIGLLGLAHQLAGEAVIAAGNEGGDNLDIEVAA